MRKEEKQLLLKDLCARLPYGVIIHNEEGYDGNLNSINQTIFGIEVAVNISATKRVDFQLDACKPYLRPMSSMTEEENEKWWEQHKDYESVDWLNSHHFDYRGLIEKGLALEAPEDMYKTE